MTKRRKVEAWFAKDSTGRTFSPPFWSKADVDQWIRTSIVRRSFYTVAHLVEQSPAAAAELRALKKENARLRSSIRWALGYTNFRPRNEGEGAYWWRSELRKRSGIDAPNWHNKNFYRDVMRAAREVVTPPRRKKRKTK